MRTPGRVWLIGLGVLGSVALVLALQAFWFEPASLRISEERVSLPWPGVGTFAVLGNHDGWLDRNRVRRAIERNGVRVVEDTAARLDTPAGALWVAGVSDLWTGPHDLDAALSAVTNASEPVLLLTHNPDVFPMVPRRVALTLAGHTHGGQVRFPWIGAPIVPSRFGQRFAAGHIVEEGRHMFVATGIGTSIIPVRFRVPPAVTILHLESDRAHGVKVIR